MNKGLRDRGLERMLRRLGAEHRDAYQRSSLSYRSEEMRNRALNYATKDKSDLRSSWSLRPLFRGLLAVGAAFGLIVLLVNPPLNGGKTNRELTEAKLNKATPAPESERLSPYYESYGDYQEDFVELVSVHSGVVSDIPSAGLWVPSRPLYFGFSDAEYFEEEEYDFT